ncbi:MAG: MFS transporter [Actinomycetota bacterium]
MRPFTKFSLGAITAAAMGVATFGQAAFGVIAADLIDEFGVDRWQVGALISAMGFTAAFLSPAFGRLTDRVGSVRSTVGVLALGMVAMVVVATAPVYGVLLAGALLSGVPNGWSNPATNALIVDHTAPGTRGVVTGIKQSGVQVGAFLGGIALPLISSASNWRVAYASFLVFPAVGLAAMWRRQDAPRHHEESERGDGRVPPVIRWVALYGILMGLGVSSTMTFLPLFANEDQGWSTSGAGLLVAGVGLVGVMARIGWGSLSERWLGHGRTLRLLAVQSSVAALLLGSASLDLLAGWVMIPAAVLLGSGVVAWNAVGMLAVMDYSPSLLVGRGTGLVLLGFLVGVGSGAPLMGLSVDAWGTYTPGWFIVGGLFAAGAVVAVGIHRSRAAMGQPAS